jgi:hypothetical protein
MTSYEFTLTCLVLMAVSYYTGRYYGNQQGIKSTLSFFESQGIIDVEYDSDEDH